MNLPREGWYRIRSAGECRLNFDFSPTFVRFEFKCHVCSPPGMLNLFWIGEHDKGIVDLLPRYWIPNTKCTVMFYMFDVNSRSLRGKNNSFNRLIIIIFRRKCVVWRFRAPPWLPLSIVSASFPIFTPCTYFFHLHLSSSLRSHQPFSFGQTHIVGFGYGVETHCMQDMCHVGGEREREFANSLAQLNTNVALTGWPYYNIIVTCGPVCSECNFNMHRVHAHVLIG